MSSGACVGRGEARQEEPMEVTPSCSSSGSEKDTKSPCPSTSSSSGVAGSPSSGEEGSSSGGRRGKDRQAKYNLRTSSLINRIQTERKRAEPKHPKPKAKPPPLSKYRRKTANARERTRMQEINQAYEDLRQVVPQMPEEDAEGAGTTKITTLRLALNYIAALRDILGYEDLYESETAYHSRSSTASDTCSSPSSSNSPAVSSPSYPTGEFSDGGPITPGQLDSEGESLVSS